MKTSELVEQVCNIKLTQYQKDFMDYLDRNPTAQSTLPRSGNYISAYELWLLGFALMYD